MNWIFNITDSPDVSIIETVWKWVKQKFYALSPTPITDEDCYTAIIKIWDGIEQERIDELIRGRWDEEERRFVDSIQDRWDAVERAGGHPTGY